MADIIVIDDEENITYSLQLALSRAGHTCRVAHSAQEGLKLCRERLPDLAIVDIQLGDADGLDVVQRLHEKHADFATIVITAFGSVARAVEAMQRGAADFIQKPLSMEEVCLSVDRCLENRQVRDQLDAFRHAQRRVSDTIEFVGQCPEVLEILSLADKIASFPNDPSSGLVSTLLLGETGTGKEVLARYMHHRGPRADRPFVHVNCMAIPESLFESELMGHERGTFTDAKEAKKGLLEIAHEGIIFLDEVGDMPLALQAKLLVAIESGRFRRLGGTRERVVDAQVIAATNADLEAKVQSGEFRSDLYFRLKTFEIKLPPLRSRGDDLMLLADYFVERYGRKLHKTALTLPTETRDVLQAYPWPGNVREMAHTLQRAVLLSEGPCVTPQSLGLSAGVSVPSVGDGSQEPSFDFSQGKCTMAEVEQRLITAAVAHTGWNISEAARLLGLTRGGLRHRMDKHGLSEPRP